MYRVYNMYKPYTMYMVYIMYRIYTGVRSKKNGYWVLVLGSKISEPISISK